MKNHKCDCMSQGPALLPVRYAVIPEYIKEPLARNSPTLIRCQRGKTLSGLPIRKRQEQP